MTSRSVALAISDAAVREEVLDTQRSFIVQAPAGSGKTELLMQRYLALLATVDEPESVLAITFTIKAASEMRNRIVAALTAAQREEPVVHPHQQRTRDLAIAVLARDRERNWQLVENPARMQIRTVDSFCESLSRRTPLLAGLGGSLNISETVKPIYDEASRRTLELLGSEDEPIANAMMTLLAHVDNDVAAVQRLFFNMLEHRDRWLRLTTPKANRADLAELRHTLEHSLEVAVNDELRELHALWKKEICAKEEERLLSIAKFAATTPDVKDQYKTFATWNDVPGSAVEELEAWQSWADWLTRDKGWRKQGSQGLGFPPGSLHPDYKRHKDNYAQAMDRFREYRREALALALCHIMRLPRPAYTDSQWDFVCALFRILPYAVENLKAIFVERGVMDFAQLSQAALEALRDGPAPARHLHHLLVDEFQDTSTTQVELLTRITSDWEPSDGRTLFLVGDPMQSIYGFREAEVVLFERTRQSGVRGLPLSSRKLEMNFRSQQPLVEWFNETFRYLLTETSDLRGAVRYEPCTAIKPPDVSPAAEIHPFYTDDPQPEAKRVVSIVQDALETTTGSVAILVRARPHLPAIIEALRHARIPYRGVDLDPLNTRQAVLDVDALAQAIEHIGDRAEWLAVLRAPWCGLPLAELWQLCRDDKYTPVIDLLRDRRGELSEDGQRRVARILPVIEQAVALYGRTTLRPLLESTWVSIGGPAAVRPGIDGEADLRDISAYFDLIDRYQVAGAMPERAMFERRLDELYAAPDTSDGVRVEIMTIYAAKGLEFETVIVPGLGRTTGGDSQALLYWRERILHGESHLLLAPMEAVAPEKKDGPPTLQDYLQHIERDRDREEGKRLLYVAATRAKRKLHLLGHVSANTGKAESDSLLALLMAAPHVGEVFVQQKPQNEEAAIDIAAAQEPRIAPMLRRLPEDWRLSVPTPAVMLKTIPTVVAVAEEPHTYDWVSDTLRRVGTVTHAFLQQIAREGLEHWSAERVARSNPAIRLSLTAEGVPASELASAVQKVSRALQAAVTEERGRWILSPHADAASELEISGVLEGVVVRIKLDRTFVDESGTRWIVDFKTADMSGSSLENFLKTQEDKYRPDLDRYARIMRALDGRMVRAGLYLPLLARWREVRLSNAPD